MKSHLQYLELFRAHRDLIDAAAPAFMGAPREARLLEAQGLPDSRTERYKYTDAEAAFAPDYGLNLRRLAPQADPYAAYKCNVPNLSTSLFFVVNDVPCPAPDSSRVLLPEGVVVEALNNPSSPRTASSSTFPPARSSKRPCRW